MQPMNYCRQMVKQMSPMLSAPGATRVEKGLVSHLLDLALVSEKFLMPDGGHVLGDVEYRALRDDEPLRLPYPTIALEYSDSASFAGAGMLRSSKRIVFARWREHEIAIMVVAWIDAHGLWHAYPEIAIPTTGYLDRSRQGETGLPAIMIAKSLLAERVPESDISGEVRVLLGLLNALSCSNVRAERHDPKGKSKKVKSALPFDSYHVLTIDASGSSNDRASAGGSHRSPREHLRRGHIRVYQSGLRIWVNATVVAAGKGAGVVKKDYGVRGKH